MFPSSLFSLSLLISLLLFFKAGFVSEGSTQFYRYYNAVMQPPYRGVVATMLGMTWARGIIFYNSDVGKSFLLGRGYSNGVATTIPTMATGIFVQFVNMPVVRGTITIQNPSCEHETVRAALKEICLTRGMKGLCKFKSVLI